MELKNIKKDDSVILLEEAVDMSKLKCERFSTGFKELDEAMLGGLKNGDLVIISGKSGQGKTTYSQTLTYNYCKQAIPTLWFSYEVTLEHLHRKFQEMNMPKHYEVFVPKINTTGHLKWVKEKIQESVKKYNTKVIFIDHIDFLVPDSAGRSSDNTSAYLKLITTQLKSLAIELEVIIVCMAHLKKLSQDQEPDMEDIGYSAGVYQLADYVLMIHRETTKKALELGEVPNGMIDRSNIYTNNAIVKIVKNRETGIAKVMKVKHDKNLFKVI